MKKFKIMLIAVITFLAFGFAQAQVPYHYTHKVVVIKRHVHHHYYHHHPVVHHHHH